MNDVRTFIICVIRSLTECLIFVILNDALIMYVLKTKQEVSNVEVWLTPEPQISQLDSQYKFGKHLTKLIGIACVGALGLISPSCVPAYVETVPSEIVYVRPIRPSNNHIWIEDYWVWNNKKGTYVHHNGYWDRPRNHQTYIQGHWKSTPRGHKWQQGHWQRNGNNGGTRHR